MSVAGEECRNGAYEERWTCPGCYHDHLARVTACASCAEPLRCTIERVPIAVCVIIDPEHEQGDDD